MAKITWTEEAERWLNSIFEYIAQENPAAATKTGLGIELPIHQEDKQRLAASATGKTIRRMPKTTLRTAGTFCLAIWASIWLMFLMMRIAPFDIRVIPGIGPILLSSLVAVLLAPIVSMAIAGVSILRKPRAVLNWLTFACAIGAFFCETLLFTLNKWL